MFKDSPAFSGFSVKNLAEAQAFYREKLGLGTQNNGAGLQLELHGGGTVFVYEKPDHQPANFTILNFPVDDIDAAIEDLRSRGVVMLHYEGLHGQDELGVMRGLQVNMGPDIAWFTDPSGNILSLLQTS